jgi:hypothetical protein
MTRKLTAATESWLRKNIPVWGTMRDHAVAAGLIEPEAPTLSANQNEAIAEIRKRVEESLRVPPNLLKMRKLPWEE